MFFNKWRKCGSILRLREDDFSWQGAHIDDERVFFRRLKADPSEFTDVLLGSLEDQGAAALFAEFIEQTLGVNSKQIRLSSIGAIDEDKALTSETFDRLVRISRSSLLTLGLSSPNAYLDQRGRKWDAIVEVGRQS